MLRSLDALEEGFRDISKKSKEQCGDKLEEIRQLIFIIKDFDRAIEEHRNPDEKDIPSKYVHSLVHTYYMELIRISGHILFFSCNGLYRNAFDDIRYILESIVQALYIDFRHPKTDIATKIEILKEVENKREYHAVRLIDELEIDHKDRLRKEYKKLSRIVHPSHEQVIASISDIFIEHTGVPATINCEEISKIYGSMKMMYDIFFFLFSYYFPEIKGSLRKNPDFTKDIKVHNLALLSKILKVRL
jgi:hypothetical protein